MASNPQERRFDRRATDSSVAALAGRLDVVETSLADNTRLTAEVHDKTTQMWAVVEPAINGFVMMGKIGNAGMRVGRVGLKVIEVGGRIARPLLFIGALAAAVVAYFKTGTFTFPRWPE